MTTLPSFDAPRSSPLGGNRPTRAFLAPERGDGRALDTDLPAYDRFRAWFTRPLLTRPAFLDAEQTRGLDHDLPLLLSTLQALPERFFDGDEAAFAQALGWTGPGLVAALDMLSGPKVPLGRADLVLGPSRFRVVEFNTSSSLGSFEFGELCRATLRDPSFREFALAENLEYLDPLELMSRTLLESFDGRIEGRPTIALTHWVTSPVQVNASLFVDLMTDLGFRVVTCTVRDLEHRGGHLYAHGIRIDAVYRTFLLKTVAQAPDAADLLAPLHTAVAEGAVGLFSPLNADLYGTKACMAMLSDDRNRDRFTPEELDTIDRLLPWTRSLANAGSVDCGGRSLLEHTLVSRENLVLKPSIGHAGQDIHAGWMTEPDAWPTLVRTAVEQNHIVQERAPSLAERFHASDGRETPSTCHLHWGMFVTSAGLSGGFVKGLLDRDQDIRYLGDGSHVGCVFHVAPLTRA